MTLRFIPPTHYPACPPAPLTRQQAQIALLAQNGYASEQIAAALGLSPDRVKAHLFIIAVLLKQPTYFVSTNRFLLCHKEAH